MNTIFVYTHRAYTSEAALLKHEGVPAEEAMYFGYEGEPPAVLWRVEDGPQRDLITADGDEALAELKAGGPGTSLCMITGTGDEDGEAPGSVNIEPSKVTHLELRD